MNPNMQPNGINGRASLHTFTQYYRGQVQANKIPPGWQQTCTPEDRAHLALQFFTQYRLLKPESPENDAIAASIAFELQNFTPALTKDQYVSNIKQKLIAMTNARQQQLQRMQGNLGNPNMPINPMNVGHMNMMNQLGSQVQRPALPPAFNPPMANSQLRQPMQVSGVSMSQQPSMAINGQAATMLVPPGLLNNQPNSNVSLAPPSRETLVALNQAARQLMDQAKPELRQKFQDDVQNWDENRRQQLRNQGIDPLFFRFRQHAEMIFRRGGIPNLQHHVSQMAALQQLAPPNRTPNQQMSMNQQAPNADIDFNAIANQQMEAMRSQGQGQQVVPASNNAGGLPAGFPPQTPQPGQPHNAAAMAQRQAQLFQQQQRQQHAQLQSQAHAQARMEQQRQQQAALNQQNQLLQGQPGGLNLNAGMQPSPAMPNLDRPMPPPGQAGPAGMNQQRPPQGHAPSINPQPGQIDPNVSALQREAQARASIVSPASQPLTEQARMAMIPPESTPHTKQQLLQMSEAQFRSILAKHRMTQAQNAGFPMQQPTQDATKIMFQQQHQQQQHLQNGMLGQMIPGSGGVAMPRPGLNFGQHGQPPPQPAAGQASMMGQRMPVMAPSQRLQQAQHLLRTSPGIIAMTDPHPFPTHILSDSLRQVLPPDVKTWQQLKQFVQQNPAVSPTLDTSKLLLLQIMHWQDMNVRGQAGMPGFQTPQMAHGLGMTTPSSITPNQGPMTTPQQQQIMANAAAAAVVVTPQEIQNFRLRLNAQPGGAPPNVNDMQIRDMIRSQKMKSREAHQQLLLQQQQQKAQLMQQAQQQRSQAQQASPAAHVPQQQLSRPPSAPLPPQATSQLKTAPRPQPPTPQPSQPVRPPNHKGVKRPSDDSNESNTPAANAAPQALSMLPKRLGVNVAQEPMAKPSPAQQTGFKAQLLKAQENASNKSQQGGTMLSKVEEIKANMRSPAKMKQFKDIVDSVKQSLAARQAVVLPPQMRAGLQASLKKELPTLKNTEYAMRLYHASNTTNEPEATIRQVAAARALLFQQINEADGTLHPHVTLTLEEFKQNMLRAITFTKKVIERLQQQQQQPGQAPFVPQPALNEANLKMAEQQITRSKVPSAPTTDKPNPFPFAPAPGSGAPSYFNESKAVPNLVLPDKKRAKLDAGNQPSAPGSKASPRVAQATSTSPEQKRQPAPEKPVPQKPTFRCQAADCEYSVRGFDTLGELEVHVGQNHVKIEDAAQFAMDSMAEFLNVHVKTGEAKVDASKPALQPAPAATLAHKTRPEAGATPGAQAVSTPMTRIPTQPGIKGSPLSHVLRTPQTSTKTVTPGMLGKATPASATKPDAPELPAVVEAKEEEQPLLPLSMFDHSYEDVFAAMDADGPFTVLDLKDEDTTWALRSRPASPTTSPGSSAKDTPSTRQSDISENDNLQIHLDMKDIDMPDAWFTSMDGTGLPVDVQISDDLSSLGVVLPAMDSEDVMLFPAYEGGNFMHLDVLEETMESMTGVLDATLDG